MSAERVNPAPVFVPRKGGPLDTAWTPAMEPLPAPTKARTQPPSMMAQGAGFLSESAKWISAGGPTVSDEVEEYRLAVCKPCPDFDAKAFFGSGRCLICGCSGLKRSWATTACPKGKWKAEV